MPDLHSMAKALRWIQEIADKEHEQDTQLRARGARTLRRIAEKAEETLNELGEDRNERTNNRNQ